MSIVESLGNPYCYFLDDAAFVETARAGFRHRVITGEHLQLCFWRIAGGARGSVLHNHTENEQLGVIMRGKLDFRIGPEGANDERIVLSEGDSYLAPRSVWHGDSVFIGDDVYGECWILDVFAPPRSDLADTG